MKYNLRKKKQLKGTDQNKGFGREGKLDGSVQPDTKRD